jgi:glycosyltransferase involved in cell wall biosynthesis
MMGGSDLIRGKATICVPNYKTLDFTRLCLRSIRKFTRYPVDVIVVDNDSQDDSLDYLRSLNWIRLIEQKNTDGNLTGSIAEGSALDIGLKNCNTEFYVVMHSDTFARREGWLHDLVGYFGDDVRTACVGAGKIDLRSKWEIVLKKSTDWGFLKRKLFGNADPYGRFQHHNRTICCLYRTETLKREQLSFMPDRPKKLTSGQPLYLQLLERGYKTVVLKPDMMRRSVIHLDHATQLIHPEQFHLKQSTVKRGNRVINEVMSSDVIKNILADSSLDN